MRLIGILILFVAAVAGYFQFYPYVTRTEQVRYRLIATINTPDGHKSGTGVWGYFMAATFDVPVFSFKWHFAGRVDGEAIPVDIGHGRTLYMVLGGRTVSENAISDSKSARFSSGLMNTLPKYPLWSDGSAAPAYFGSNHAGAVKEIEWIKAQQGRTVSLDCSPRLHSNPSGDCPAIVLASRSGSHIEMLDPDNLSEALGPGYSLGDVTLQVTNDPVSQGIEQRLPWVRSVRDHGGRTPGDELKQIGFSRHDPVRL